MKLQLFFFIYLFAKSIEISAKAQVAGAIGAALIASEIDPD
jgi:activator of 2-hydroxyglutaryl-CoA dehydratase